MLDLPKNYSNNATKICKEYAGIKAYQFLLYRFLRNQTTRDIDVPNVTISEIVYLLQIAGQSLQAIQVRSHTINYYSYHSI